MRSQSRSSLRDKGVANLQLVRFLLAMKSTSSIWLVAVFVLLTSTVAYAQTLSLDTGRNATEAEGIVDLPRLNGSITLDGLSDEPAWQGVTALPLTMYEPSYRGGTERKVELLLAYDSEAVYIAGRFYHQDPSLSLIHI